MMERQNLAARAGRWSAAHWKTALVGWLVFCVVAVVVGRRVGTKALKDADTASGETASAREDPRRRRLRRPRRRERARAVEDADRSNDPRSARRWRRRPHGFGAAGRRARPLAARRRRTRGQISKDGRSAIVQFEIRGDEDKATGQGRSPCSTPSPASRRAPGLHGRGVRRGERQPRARRDARQGLPARRVLVAAGDADRSCCSRSARSSPPGCRCCSPSRACSRRSGCRRSPATSSRPATRRSP